MPVGQEARALKAELTLAYAYRIFQTCAHSATASAEVSHAFARAYVITLQLSTERAKIAQPGAVNVR